MRVIYEMVTRVMVELLKTMMGVKSNVVETIDVKGFVNTILLIVNVGRDDCSIQGYTISEYKLDNRFKLLVAPKAVYASLDRLAFNLRVMDDCSDLTILSPSQFAMVQSELIGAMRKSPELDLSMDTCIKEVELASIISNVSYNGSCHYDTVSFMPIPLVVNLYKQMWYNIPDEEMIKELVVAILKNFK